MSEFTGICGFAGTHITQLVEAGVLDEGRWLALILFLDNVSTQLYTTS